MPHFGYFEIEVRLMRQGHGTDSSGEPGSGFGVEDKKTIRLEERDARDVRDGGDEGFVTDSLMPVARVIHDILEREETTDIQGRLYDAVERATPERRRKALRVLIGADE